MDVYKFTYLKHMGKQLLHQYFGVKHSPLVPCKISF